MLESMEKVTRKICKEGNECLQVISDTNTLVSF
jgi:hypothetical protein